MNPSRPSTTKRKRVIVLVLLLAGILGLSSWLNTSTQDGHLGNSSNKSFAALDGTGAVAARADSPDGIRRKLEEGSEEDRNQQEVPPGFGSSASLREAMEQDSKVPRGVPEGRVTHSREGNASPLALNPNQFTTLGPQPLKSYYYSYGRVGGRVTVLLIDPVTPNVAYMGVSGGGLWKSTNCCTSSMTWQSLLDSPSVPTNIVDDVTLDPTNHNVLYVATGDRAVGWRGLGILKSTDAGASWVTLGETLSQASRYISRVRVDPRNNSRIVAGMSDGLSFSYDGGATWSAVCTPHSFAMGRTVTDLLLRDNGSSTEIYAAVGHKAANNNGGNGIYKTTFPASGCPGAGSWTLTTTEANGWPAGTGNGTAGAAKPGRIDMASAPGASNIMYAAVQNLANHSLLGVWRTTDAGATWAKRASASNLIECDNTTAFSAQHGYNQAIAVDPNNPNNLYLGSLSPFRSTDGGATFRAADCNYVQSMVPHIDQHYIAYLPGSSSTLLIGTDGGTYLTTNANVMDPTWYPVNEPLNTIEFYSGDITANFANSASPGAIGGAQDNGTSTHVWNGNPGPALWQQRVGADGGISRIEPVHGQRWYAQENGGLLVSTTGPEGKFVDAAGGWGNASPRYEIYKGNPADPTNDCNPTTGCTHMIAGTNRVWETIQGAVPASSWYSNSPVFGTIYDLTYAPSTSAVAMVTTNAKVYFGFNLGQGAADTANWVDVTRVPSFYVRRVAIDPSNPLVGYGTGATASSHAVFQVTCTANCASFTWTDRSGNLPGAVQYTDIIANPRYPQQVFVGSEIGLYYTNDIRAASPVWYRFQLGLPNVSISELTVDRGATTLAVWTQSRGAFAWPLPGDPAVLPTATTQPTATRQPTATTQPTSITQPTPTRQPTSITQPTATRQPTSITQATPTRQPTSITQPTPGGTVCGTFNDVPAGSTFHEVVQCLACRNIIGGYPCGAPGEGCPGSYFRPGVNVTRGQISKMVALAANLNGPTGNQIFEDVAPDSTYYNPIQQLASRSYISGYPCGTRPDEPCVGGLNRPYFRSGLNTTRGQLSKIVSETARISDDPGGQKFSDVPVNSAFFVWINRLANQNVIGGYPCGCAGEPCDAQTQPYFRPGTNVTRGQTAKIVASTFYPNCQTSARSK
ncbi:MAG: hypothetical protein M3390_12490 [Chloroflexota bacterium]|nr:hypothetical protein [Chloroflexota bacterium]